MDVVAENLIHIPNRFYRRIDRRARQFKPLEGCVMACDVYANPRTSVASERELRQRRAICVCASLKGQRVRLIATVRAIAIDLNVCGAVAVQRGKRGITNHTYSVTVCPLAGRYIRVSMLNG
jgi:hypothetical protein